MGKSKRQEKSRRRFYVVEFRNKNAKNTVDFVPCDWVASGTCKWPRNVNSKTLDELKVGLAEPDKKWKTFYNIRIRYKTDDLELARLKADEAVEETELSQGESQNDSEDDSADDNNELRNISSSSSSTEPAGVTAEAFEKYQMKMFQLLESMKQDIADLRNMVGVQRSGLSGCPMELPEDLPKFPIDTPEGLNTLNSYLDEIEKFSQMCLYFGNLGGSTHASLVRRILQTIMTNQLSLQYNWRGTGGLKLGFAAFGNVIKLISSAVRLHKQFEGVTDHEIEKHIKKWLVYAKDREGGRANRAKVL